MNFGYMKRAVLFLFLLIAAAAAAETLADAALLLTSGQGDKAAAALLAYGRSKPAAPLANQALDCVLLLQQKKVKPEAMAPYVEALGLLADGYTDTADAAFRDMAADKKTPWPVRGRAVLVAAELNAEGDRLDLLAEAWRECDDATARLLGIALADAYYKLGDVKAAREVRDDYKKRFPGDEGAKYFDYLQETGAKK